MQAITLNQAIQSFTNLMDDVSNNHEPLIITHEHHKAVVLMSLDDFNAWQETDYLTRSIANANDLLQAVNDIKERKNIVKQSLIEEHD
jgi:antitoxin YefM